MLLMMGWPLTLREDAVVAEAATHTIYMTANGFDPRGAHRAAPQRGRTNEP